MAVGNVTLLTFAADCCAAVAPLLLGAHCAATDISCLPGPWQQTRYTLLQRSTAETDRWTDGRTPYHCIDPATYYASSVNNSTICISDNLIE